MTPATWLVKKVEKAGGCAASKSDLNTSHSNTVWKIGRLAAKDLSKRSEISCLATESAVLGRMPKLGKDRNSSQAPSKVDPVFTTRPFLRTWFRLNFWNGSTWDGMQRSSCAKVSGM